MIPEVKQGQRISAAAQNAVIKRVNGLQTPSDSFVNTPDGTLTPVKGYEPRYGYFPVPSTVLQAKRGPAVRMTRRGTKTDYDRYDVTEEVMTWHVLLGPDVGTLLKVLPSKNPPSAVWLGGATPDLTIEITDVFLQSLRRAECYADLAAYGETALAVKEVKLTDSSRQSDPGMTILVICGTSFRDFSKMLDAYGSYDTAAEANSVLFAKIDGEQDPFMLPLKAPASSLSSAEYTGDSQVPVLHLSSVAVKNVAGENYVQLHEFQADNTKQVSSLNPARVDVLVRNRAAAGGRELQYVALSSLSGGGESTWPPDADVPEAGMSSIQTYESDGGPVEELYNFHDLSTVSVDCGSLSGYDIVMRDPETMTVRYGRLSIDILPDSSASEQSSVAWLGGKTLQLWNFDDLSCGTSSVCRLSCNSEPAHLLSGAEFLYRENGELKYGKLDMQVSCDRLEVDSDVSVQKSIDDSDGVLQLHDMDKAAVQMSAELTEDLDDVLSGGYEFVARTGRGGEIKYVRLKLKAQDLSVDTDSSDEYGQRSIDWTQAGELQLYGMDEDGETRDVALTSADTSLLSDGYEFVVRKGGAGGIIGYTTISAQLSGLHSVDTEVVRTQKSVELKKSGNAEYAQLYGMDAQGGPDEAVDMGPAATYYQPILPDDEEFVVRTGAGGEIKYKNVKLCLSAYAGGGGGDRLIVDSDYDEGQGYSNHFSLDEETLSSGEKLLRLHDFTANGTVTAFYEPGDGQTRWFPQGGLTSTSSDRWYTLVRHDSGDGWSELEYRQIAFRSRDWQGQIDDANSRITNANGRIDELGNDVEDLSSQISGTWRTGGGETTNNADTAYLSTGLSVGSPGLEVVIRSNTVKVGNSEINDGIIESGGSVKATGPYATLHADGTMNSYLKLGNTTLSESQLQRLLQLI